VYSIAHEIEAVGQIMTEATEEIQRLDRAGKGFGGRLHVAKKTARRLAEPSDHLAQLGGTFASQMHQVDGGIRALIQAVAEADPVDADELTPVCEFFSAIRLMAAASEPGLAQVEEMVNQATALETQSRDLRAPLRRMRHGLTLMLEARAVVREWVRMIDASGVDCNPPEPTIFAGPPAEPQA
jgi:methyl-accepting chemotaxis protein